MIKCPSCNADLVTNTIFCNTCGYFMLQSDERITDPVGYEIDWLGDDIDRPKSTSSPQPDSMPLSLELTIGSQKQKVDLPLSGIIHLGRRDLALEFTPTVDLTTMDSLAQTVSRQHVKVFKQGNKVMIEDLASTNGTFLNGKRLAPYVAELLSNGDMLQLGQLLIAVKIQNSPN